MMLDSHRDGIILYFI